jgi:hypothetical protein
LDSLFGPPNRYLTAPLKNDEKPQFDFVKWLRDERKRLAKERKKEQIPPSGSKKIFHFLFVHSDIKNY